MSKPAPSRSARPVTALVAGVIAIAVGAMNVVTCLRWFAGAGGTDNPSGVRMAAAFIGVFALVFIVLGICLLQGLNWARIVLTGLAALALLASLAEASRGSATAMSAITAAITLSLLVLMWLPASSDWFRRDVPIAKV